MEWMDGRYLAEDVVVVAPGRVGDVDGVDARDELREERAGERARAGAGHGLRRRAREV